MAEGLGCLAYASRKQHLKEQVVKEQDEGGAWLDPSMCVGGKY